MVVLVGATGDLSARKLLPGLFYLSSAGFIPGCRIVGVSLDQIDRDGFRKVARAALDQFSTRKVKEADWAAFAETLDYVPIGAGADALKAAAAEAERKLGNENSRLHYLSVPPKAAVARVRGDRLALLARRHDLLDRWLEANGLLRYRVPAEQSHRLSPQRVVLGAAEEIYLFFRRYLSRGMKDWLKGNLPNARRACAYGSGGGSEPSSIRATVPAT